MDFFWDFFEKSGNVEAYLGHIELENFKRETNINNEVIEKSSNF